MPSCICGMLQSANSRDTPYYSGSTEKTNGQARNSGNVKTVVILREKRNKPLRFNLSRRHSPLTHDKTCAVVGCPRRTRSGEQLCCRHGDDPEIVKALSLEVEKLNVRIRDYNQKHVRADCIRQTDSGPEVDCNCSRTCQVCYPSAAS